MLVLPLCIYYTFYRCPNSAGVLVLFLLFQLWRCLFIHLLMAVLGLCCCTDFSLVAASRGYAQASHCSDFSCGRAQAQGQVGSEVAAPQLWSTALIVVVQGFNCFEECGIFPDQESNQRLHCEAGSSLLSHLGSPQRTFKFSVAFTYEYLYWN